MNSSIKTFEDACKATGIDPKILPDVSQLPEDFQKRAIANYKMDVINKALNDEGLPEPWVADYSDSDQRKYEPWFDFSPGSGWSYLVCAYWSTYTFAGARRNFRSREIAKYAATQFIEIYNDILN